MKDSMKTTFQGSSDNHEGGDQDVLVEAKNVGKIFCRDFKRSLFYGATDGLKDLLPGMQSGRQPGPDGHVQLRKKEFWANRGISFRLRRGECLGLVGSNGAGKTTLLKMLCGLVKPDTGEIRMRGRIGAIIALGAGFDPILTGRENIYVNASVLGLTRSQIDAKFDEIVDFADIRDFIDAPVRSYSSGMVVRLGFAVATAIKPDVLLLDEVLAVGDANFRGKCMQRIGEVLANSAVIFVSHDAHSIRRVCNRVMLMRRGESVFMGDTSEGMTLYADSDGGTGGHLKTEVLAPYIHNLRFHGEHREEEHIDGETISHLHVDIQFSSDRAVAPGVAMANIFSQGEEAVAQSLFHGLLQPLRVGENRWQFEIPDIRLARGNYSLVILVFEEDNKLILMNLRHYLSFKVKGNERFGPTYALRSVPVTR